MQLLWEKLQKRDFYQETCGWEPFNMSGVLWSFSEFWGLDFAPTQLSKISGKLGFRRYWNNTRYLSCNWSTIIWNLLKCTSCDDQSKCNTRSY